jgi:rod shape-determining protein MreD
MVRSIVVSTLIVVACDFAQSTWFSAISVLGVKPDLALLVLIWLSYQNGSVAGSAAGFLSGLAQDFISASPIGFNAFIKTAVASAAGLLHGSFYIDRLLLPVILGAAGTLAKALAAGLLFLVFGSKLHAYELFGRTLWLEAAYNGVIAPLVFLLLSPLKGAVKAERGRE